MNHKRWNLPLEQLADARKQEQKTNQWLEFLIENRLTEKQILVL